MKQRIILSVILTLVFAQGWTSPVDSLRIKTNTEGLTGFFNDSVSNDGWGRADFTNFDGGLNNIDFINPGWSTETNSNSSEHKLWISYPSNGKVTFSDVMYSSKAIFIIKSEHVKKYTLTITGDDKDSFTLDSYRINLGGLKNWNSRVIQQAVTITFRPQRAGTHKAQVYIKDSNGNASCTLTVEGTAIPFIYSSEFHLYFDPTHKTRSFRVYGVHLKGPLYLSPGSGYSVSPTYIPASNAMSLEGVVVKVTCNTTRVGETKLTIRSIGADDFVYLNYSSGSANAPGLNIEPDEPDEPFETDGNSADKVSFEPWNNGSTSLYEVTQAAKVYAEGQTIVIESPVEQSAVVCDIAGRGQTVNLMEGRNEIPVNSSGIYIVRIREKTVKLLLK